MRALFLTAIAATVAAPALAQGQADAASQPSAPAAAWSTDVRLAAPVDATLLPVGLATAETAPLAAAPTAARRSAGSVMRPLVPGVMGAVLGGWVGYVASQVARSDWDKESNGEFASYRLGFAAGGAAVGAVTGVVLGHSMSGGPGGNRTPRVLGANTRNAITAEEMQGARARNAQELIQTLRPRWLNTRGTNTFGETAQGSADDSGVSITPGVSPIKVYMNNTFMGDVTVLSNIPMGSFTEVHYYDMAQATYRWGQGHAGGAIEFISAPTAN